MFLKKFCFYLLSEREEGKEKERDRNISNKQPNPTLQELKEEKQTQPKVEGRK